MSTAAKWVEPSPLDGAVPRVLVVEREVQRGDAVHLTAISDLHLESAACDVEGLRAILFERAKLPNHSVVIIGDALDLINNGDPRNRPSVQAAALHGRDDWVNQAIERAASILNVPGITYDLIGVGNHEDGFTQRHGFDPTSALAHRVGAARGGYSGVIDYRIIVKRNKAGFSRCRARVLYHHGAWGGALAKGYMGAFRWASQWDQWRVMLFGHDHQSVHHVDRRVRVRQTGELEEYDSHLVNCSSWASAYAHDARVVCYPERKGLRRQPRLAPLITFKPRMRNGRTGHGDGRIDLDVTVTM